MESLRIDLRSTGIDVTVVAPGFVRTKPGKKKNRPFRLELEAATALIHRAIKRRTPYYAFPKSLVVLMWLGWALPAPLVRSPARRPRGREMVEGSSTRRSAGSTPVMVD